MRVLVAAAAAHGGKRRRRPGLLQLMLLTASVLGLMMGLAPRVAKAAPIEVENYVTASEKPGSTALVPEPGKLYLRAEAKHPYLAPLPADRGQGKAKWCVGNGPKE